MVFTFLGTGTSGGVPSLGCKCEVCKSKDCKDKRLRSAGVLENEGTRLLIDCGPDIRQQLLRFFSDKDFYKFDGVLLTHIHYDHVAGIDDLRPMCAHGDIDIYADECTINGLHSTMPYCFTEHLYPGVPKLTTNVIDYHKQFNIGSLSIMPIKAMHRKLPIVVYRIDKFAYLTDVKTIPDEEFEYLRGVDTLVINALRWEKEHYSHLLVTDAIEYIKKIGAKRAYLTHLTHEIGFHDEAEKRLQLMAKDMGYYGEIHFAYDGLKINI